jgi:hypothetical protein
MFYNYLFIFLVTLLGLLGAYALVVRSGAQSAIRSKGNRLPDCRADGGEG